MWELYDSLISRLPDDLIVEEFTVGALWTAVKAGGTVGVAMTVKSDSRPPLYTGAIYGAPLRKIAECAKSWNFMEASLGVAALNAYYNAAERVKYLPGVEGLDPSKPPKERAFVALADELSGKRVAVIGHFPDVEERLGSICELSVLERNPQPGDYPDSACETILPEQDYVLITGTTLTNKTLPRLLQIIKGQVFMVGPSVPLSPLMFRFGVRNLSGFCVTEEARLWEYVRSGRQMGLFECGRMVSVTIN